VFKLSLALGLGGREFRRAVAPGLLALSAAALAGLWIF
jgi:hypothetical protein